MQSLAAQDYFLAPDGNDEHDGRSAAQAWKTLARASRSEYSPGDKVFLKSGAEFSGELSLKITGGGKAEFPVEVTSTPGDKSVPATILAGDGNGVAIRDTGVRIFNLVIKGSGPQTNIGTGVRVFNDRPNSDKRSDVCIQDLKISGFGHAGIKIEGACADKSASGYSDVMIERCTVSDGMHYGIFADGFEQPLGSWKFSHADIVVRGCEVFGISGNPNKHDNHSGNGILIGNVDGALIEKCCAHDNGAKNGSHDGGPVGIWAYCGRKVVIQYCEAYANRAGVRNLDGGGFDLDGGISDSIMQYNYSHDNDGAGYLVYSYKDAPHEFRDNIVRFNVSINDGRRGDYGGIAVGQHGNMNMNSLIHNNLVILGGSEKGKATALASCNTSGMRVFNNIFMVRKGAYLMATWGNPAGKELTIAGNTWHYEDKTLLLAAAEPVAAVNEWLAKMRLPVETWKDLPEKSDIIPASAAETLWPRDVNSLKPLFARIEKADATALDLSKLGVKMPSQDFFGKPVPKEKFAGPFAP
jgi:hypothetical protein